MGIKVVESAKRKVVRQVWDKVVGQADDHLREQAGFMLRAKVKNRVQGFQAGGRVSAGPRLILKTWDQVDES